MRQLRRQNFAYSIPSGAAALQPMTSDDEFALFWATYPKFGKQALPLARRAFAKARTKASLDIILRALDAYIGHLSVHDWLRPCYAATWLNQERWLAEYDSPASVPTQSESRETSQWRLRVKAYGECKFWDGKKFWLSAWGETPDDPRCMAPIEVLREFGYRAVH